MVSVMLVAASAGCGSNGSRQATTKADWQRQHGAAISAVGTELDLARKALTQGDRQSILGACGLLGDDVAEARKGLPAPDPTVDSTVRQALDAVDAGARDCLQGARIASVASLNEKAMAELTDARAKLDAANQSIATWR